MEIVWKYRQVEVSKFLIICPVENLCNVIIIWIWGSNNKKTKKKRVFLMVTTLSRVAIIMKKN